RPPRPRDASVCPLDNGGLIGVRLVHRFALPRLCSLVIHPMNTSCSMLCNTSQSKPLNSSLPCVDGSPRFALRIQRLSLFQPVEGSKDALGPVSGQAARICWTSLRVKSLGSRPLCQAQYRSTER